MPDTLTALAGTHNFRDVGGLRLSDGGTVAAGVLYRSDAPSALTRAGIAALAASDIGAVADLRTDAERGRAPDLLPDGGSVRLVELPILGGAMDELVGQLMPAGGVSGPLPAEIVDRVVASLPTLADLYVEILRVGAPAFAEVGRLVAAPADSARGAVLVHCTAGKDRTGLATALLLEVAGAERDDILADYTRTTGNLAGDFGGRLLGMVTALGIPDVPRLRALTTEAPVEAIEAALHWVHDNQGDAAAYLRSGGLTDAELDAVRSRLRGA